MSVNRVVPAAIIGSALALACASAAAQTNASLGTPVGASGVGAPGTGYGAAVATNPGVGSVATPGLGYMSPGSPIGFGYVSTPSTTSIGAANTIGTGGAQGAFPGTAVWTGPAAILGTTGATIEGYGSGLTSTGYAAVPGTTARGTTPGAGPVGAGATVPGYAGPAAGAYMGEIYGIEGLFP